MDREKQLKEAEVRQAVGRDNIPEKLGNSKPPVQVVGYGWATVVVAQVLKGQLRVKIANRKMVLGEENELSIAAQGSADKEQEGWRSPAGTCGRGSAMPTAAKTAMRPVI